MQKIDLKVEAPAGHVLIKIHQVGIMVHILEMGNPFIMLAQHFRECGFTRADIAGNSNMFWFFRFSHSVPVPVGGRFRFKKMNIETLPEKKLSACGSFSA